MITSNKKIIFFDGDGTLWYPKSTGWAKKPDWIYSNQPAAADYLPLLKTTPRLFSTLRHLKKHGFILIAVSIHPHPRQEADVHMKTKMQHFKLDTLFHEFYTARPFFSGKARIITQVLKKRRIAKSHALLIGDSYTYDYLSAKSIGVGCILINTPYLKQPTRGRKISQRINTLAELKNLITEKK